MGQQQVNIGKGISDLVEDYPTYKHKPQNVPEEDRACWIHCPYTKVSPFFFTDGFSLMSAATDYCCALTIYSETRAKLDEALDYVINRAQEEIHPPGQFRFWLYAVKISRTKKGSFQATVKYYLRVVDPEKFS